ncbi:MAG: sensor histidine kinase [Bacteroidetes bacterium]|nr:sensor histidine kinase [Bacteroidota bacterium]
MFTQISLIVSILLQFATAILALTLIRKTKYLVSWILISVGLLLMAIRRLFELGPSIFDNIRADIEIYDSWLAIMISVVMTVGVIFVTRIFKYLSKLEKIRARSEQRVLNAIINTEEKERKRFAKDLHDGLGPLLSTVKMSVSSLSATEQTEINRKILENVESAINEALATTKELSNNLSPHILDNFGLLTAINAFIERMAPLKTINVQMESNLENQRLGYNVEVVLYRVICELINNTVRHASARNLFIDIFLKDESLSVKFSDDGKGFNPDIVLSSSCSGLGLANITSRIKSIDGEIEIQSSENEGTIINMVIPASVRNSMVTIP